MQLILLRLISPMTGPIGTRVLRSIRQVNPVTTTPREAQKRFGYAVPAQAHLALRAKQANRVFG